MKERNILIEAEFSKTFLPGIGVKCKTLDNSKLTGKWKGINFEKHWNWYYKISKESRSGGWVWEMWYYKNNKKGWNLTDLFEAVVSWWQNENWDIYEYKNLSNYFCEMFSKMLLNGHTIFLIFMWIVLLSAIR